MAPVHVVADEYSHSFRVAPYTVTFCIAHLLQQIFQGGGMTVDVAYYVEASVQLFNI